MPIAIFVLIPQNIRHASQIRNGPRHTVTVTSKRAVTVNENTNVNWVGFSEPIATTPWVEVTEEEFAAASPGSQLTITILPDGKPHSINSGGNVLFEICMLVIAVVVWLAALAYIIAVARRSRRGKT